MSRHPSFPIMDDGCARGRSPLTSVVALALLSAAILAPPALAGGLRCSVGEVVIENLRIGHTYSLETLAKLPLSITNTSDHAVRVSIEPMVPSESELRQGAEAIPSVDWAAAAPDTLELSAGETQQTDMTLVIPDDESLFGRKFQAMFWSHTLPQAGSMLAYGLKSRVIFTIDQVREGDGPEPTGDMSFTLLPARVKLDSVRPGKTYRLEKAASEPLKVRNTSDHPVTVELKAISLEEAGSRPEEGYADLLGAARVELEPASFSLAPGEERTVEGTVAVAKQSGSKSRDLACVIAAAVTDMEVKTQIYSRIYVQTH
jgi:hypothetical protein